MRRHKKPDKDLKLSYRKTLEVGFIGSLFLHLILFQVAPELVGPQELRSEHDIIINVAEIPPTEQRQPLKRPPRPSVPVPTMDEDVPEDLTIESTELDLSEIPPPPPFEEDDTFEHYQFIVYDEPPTPIGGYASIQKNLVYPKVAQKTGLEGYVVIGLLIDENGRPLKTEVLKPCGSNIGFEAAAINALKSVRWRPARQRDLPVKVWISIPVRFSLRDHNT